MIMAILLTAESMHKKQIIALEMQLDSLSRTVLVCGVCHQTPHLPGEDE